MIVKKARDLASKQTIEDAGDEDRDTTQQFKSSVNNKGRKKMIEILQFTFETNHQGGQLRQIMWKDA